jgi:histidine ammonia-lyase
MQEDHVSMGWNAARKLRRSIDGLGRVIAIELLTSARAMDMRAPVHPSEVSSAVRARLREDVEGPGTDRYLAPEIAAAHRLVLDGSLLAAAASVVSERGEELV